MLKDKRAAPLVLSVIGAVFYVLGDIRLEALGLRSQALLVIPLIVLAIVGAVLMRSSGTVRKGSFLTLFAAILGFASQLVAIFTNETLFHLHTALIIGSILGLVAAILGLKWKPRMKQPQPSTVQLAEAGKTQSSV